MMPQRYAGSPDAPLPPCPADWLEVPATDRLARARAHVLVDQLAPYTFVDERGPSGLVRYFAYETAFGRTVSAIAPVGGGEGEGTLGATNPSFAPPTPAQVAATPPGDALSNAGVALLTAFEANGVPSEHISDPSTLAFQQAWNADPLSQVNGANGSLADDGGYGPNVHDALASIAGGTAPAVNTGGATPTPLTGQTTLEPVPATDATCGAWAVDATNPQAQAIAANIAFHNSPVAWSDQGDYTTTIGGVDYLFVMWWEKGLKAIAAYKCTSGSAAGGGGSTTASTTSGSSSATTAVIAGTLAVASLVAVGFAARKPLKAAYHHHVTRHAHRA